MPKIKMLATTPGSETGIFTKDYEAGQEYEVGEDLRRAFVDELGVAVDVKPPAKKKTTRRKKS